ncbi:MAG: 3-phosphoshikimate 1-carboxyvinyltransferase [Gammaproteobacteria bacterium]|nr:3-phosphoshikimate 1-carboxyvinyltransferase [Gammaproteobacteria bacterium]
MTNFIVQPGGEVSGEILVPGDKSISHRSIMFGSLANGITNISGFLMGEDSLATLAAFRAMGVNIEGPDDKGNITIEGVGMKGLKKPDSDLDLGNSGTSMRLLTGLLSAQDFDVRLIGDQSLSSRPMKRVVAPVKLMGGKIETDENNTAPLSINGSQRQGLLNGIAYHLPVASAQVKSCLLLAGMYAKGKTCVTEPAPTRDHTERMLESFGYPLDVINLGDGKSQICLDGGYELKACDLHIPSDISSAAFFMVAACIADNSNVVLKHVGINPTRDGIINILKLMGADIEIHNEKMIGAEPVADIVVKTSKLQGISIPEDQVPLAIDEFPIISIAAACAEGQTILTGAEELRVKESDRIQAMIDGMTILGIDCEGTTDGMIINGGDFTGGEVDSCGDHRIAMSFVMAALRAKDIITVLNCDNVNTSFPGFVELSQQVGIRIQK